MALDFINDDDFICLYMNTHLQGPWDLLKSVQMLKREWDAKSNGNLPHLFIPSKTATFIPEFVEEDLPLGRTAVLVPEFVMKDLPLSRTL